MAEEDKNIIYGRNSVIDALESGKELEVIYIQKGVTAEFERSIKAIANKANIAVKKVPKEALDRMVKANHQGIVAEGMIVTYARLEDIVKKVLSEKEKKALFVILDGITDVRNFGAIARSCEVMGVDAIIIPDRNSVRITADALKTSSGALSRIPVAKVGQLEEVVTFFAESGIPAFASDLKSSVRMDDCDFNQSLALIIGSEDKGVSKKLLAYADETFLIPQVGNTNSLNVSVATGIILYEVLRQRSVTIQQKSFYAD